MALPWIIGGLAVATVAYLASDDDDSSSSDREDREREARRRAKEKQNREIREEISDYKESQILKIEEKYGANIFFDNHKESKVLISHQDKEKEKKIDDLSNEITGLEEALKKLETIKNETF